MTNSGRKPRIHIPNTIHHVMVRGNNRQCIFYSEEYFTRFLQIIDESTKKFDYKLIGYCLMTNHIHLVVKINQSPLSKVMQNINYRYVRWLNKKNNRIGHLFQGRYHSIEVCDEMYLINLFRYIHLNPTSAKIVSCLDDYLWSSHKNYISDSYPKWMDSNFMINIIQNKTGFNYKDFINQSVQSEKWIPNLFLSESGEIIINDDSVKVLNNENKPYPEKFF